MAFILTMTSGQELIVEELADMETCFISAIGPRYCEIDELNYGRMFIASQNVESIRSQ